MNDDAKTDSDRKRHHVEIELDGHGMGTVKLDGKEIKGCRGVSFTATAMELPTVAFRVYAESVKVRAVTGEVTEWVSRPDETGKALERIAAILEEMNKAV